MIEITITTKAGKFVMKGEEFVSNFGAYLMDRGRGANVAASCAVDLNAFLSTYEEEVPSSSGPDEQVKTSCWRYCEGIDGFCTQPNCTCHD